jgi:hypothetical protein
MLPYGYFKRNLQSLRESGYKCVSYQAVCKHTHMAAYTLEALTLQNDVCL